PARRSRAGADRHDPSGYPKEGIGDTRGSVGPMRAERALRRWWRPLDRRTIEVEVDQMTLWAFIECGWCGYSGCTAPIGDARPRADEVDVPGTPGDSRRVLLLVEGVGDLARALSGDVVVPHLASRGPTTVRPGGVVVRHLTREQAEASRRRLVDHRRGMGRAV